MTDPVSEKQHKSTEQWEHESTDPTIPFDGALPENIPGPASNVEADLAASKRAAAYGQQSTYLRPEHARQKAKTGDAITDSDVIANPAADFEVAQDNGADERNEPQAKAQDVQGRSSTPPRKTTAAAPEKPKA